MTPSAGGGGEESVDLQGRMLGEFRLLRRLGRGGMAEVYLAEQTTLGRQVAVKVLRAERLAETDDVHLKRFAQEAKAAAALSHPHIVQVYSIGEQEGVHYIAQEYVQGLNLREFLKKKGPPDLPLALHVMKQVAAALQKAGEAGIVHRDVKPENIMISRKGAAKIADFGLAQLTQGGERVHLTQDNVTMGTPLYMSPEQVQGKKQLDHRSDLYSFGVTCYHMLAGEPPFRGETALGIALQHLKNDPEPLSQVRPDLPPALCQIVHKLMAKNPDDRYPTALAVLKDLRQVESVVKQTPEAAARFSLSGAVDDVGGKSTMLTRVGRRVSRWSVAKRVAALVALCLLAALPAAALGWGLRPGDPLKTPPDGELPSVPAQKSAEQQYTVTLLATPYDEYAWRTMIARFPDSEYRLKAEQHLGLLYLRQLRLDEADEVFRKLEQAADPEYQAAGLAGRAVVASLRGSAAESQALLDQLKPLAGRLDRDSELERYVQEAHRRNAGEMGG